MSLRLLSPVEKYRLIASLDESYSMNSAFFSDYEIVEWEGGYWAVSPMVLALPLRKMRVESVGLLLARGRTLIPTVAAIQLFCRAWPDPITLSRKDALAFIDRKAVAVNASEGRHVVFFGGRALDLGEVSGKRLSRVGPSRDGGALMLSPRK